MFFPAFDNEWVSSKLGPFGEAHGEFRPTRLPPLQCAFKSFQDNDIMRKMPVSCCLDKFGERCASSHSSASLQVGELDTVGSVFQKQQQQQLSCPEIQLQPFKKWPDFQTSQTAHSIPLQCMYFWKPDDVSGRSWMLSTLVIMTCGHVSYIFAEQGSSMQEVLPLLRVARELLAIWILQACLHLTAATLFPPK